MMNFWLRNIVLGCILTVLAWTFFINQNLLMSSDYSPSTVSTTSTLSPLYAEPPVELSSNADEKYQLEQSSSNAAAAGLSKFYANIYGENTGKGPKIRNNIIFLPEPQGSVSRQLKAKEMLVKPHKNNWLNTTQSRPFRRGETLRQRLAELTHQEGIELIWWLNRDYVVKEPFRVETNILKTTYIVSKSVEGHFPSGLSVFFCNKQLTLVVIETGSHKYLTQQCDLLSVNPYDD